MEPLDKERGQIRNVGRRLIAERALDLLDGGTAVRGIAMDHALTFQRPGELILPRNQLRIIDQIP